MNIAKTTGYKLIAPSTAGNVRVVCPDCGSGGASSYPCVCKCGALMLPTPVNNKFKNWNEVFKPC